MSYGFSLLPPEILSGLIYSGPGSGPLTAAAAAWAGLAEELTTTAVSVQSTVTGLDGTWQGGSASLMTAAIAPYVSWMEATAAQAGQMAAQATTAAALFETAHAATVPPPVIAANRALLLALVSTNFFGQNTPAIAATEAQYEAMWGQDAATMETYAATSDANNNSLQQPTSPPQVSSQQANPAAAQAPPDTGSTGTGATTTPVTGYDPSTVGGLFDLLKVDPSALGIADQRLLASNISQLSSPATMAMSYGSMGMRYLMMLQSLTRMGGATGAMAGQNVGQGAGTLMSQIGEFVNGKLQGAVGTLVGHFNTATQTISAKLGQAASMGALKVPQAWSAAADGMVRAAPVLPQTVSAPAAAMSGGGGLPGGPFGNALMGALAGRGVGSIAAKAPKIVPRSPAGG